MSLAARVTDLIVSSATLGAPVPIATPGAPTVLIAGLPAACVGSSCGVDAVVMGSTAVMAGGLPAARVGDPTGAGGSIVGVGAPTVIIGG
jgi:uncharacterized Zn-binding protein involved in type VI secretion